jgi:hypothetical protein
VAINLEILKEQLSSDQVLEASRLLAEFLETAGSDWQNTLTKSGVVPGYSPGNGRGLKITESLGSAAKLIAGENSMVTERAKRIQLLTIGLGWVASLLQGLEDDLEKSGLLDSSLADIVGSVAGFVTDQSRYGTEHALSQTTGPYEISEVISTSIPGPYEGHSKISPQGHGDSIAASAELILRYAMFRQLKLDANSLVSSDAARLAFGGFDAGSLIHDQYNGRLFKTYGLSTSWISLQRLVEEIRYSGWYPHLDDPVLLFFNDAEDLAARYASENRRLMNQALLVRHFVFTEVFGAAMKTLKDSIAVPNSGEIWNGSVDPLALRVAAESSPFLVLDQAVIVQRHLHSLLHRISFSAEGVEVPFEDLFRIWTAIRVLLMAMEEVDKTEGRGFVLRVDLAHLASTISSAVEVPQDKTLAVCQKLVFDYRRKRLDIFDQPLLPIGGSEVLLVPLFVCYGNTQSIFEDWYLDFNARENIDVRSEKFELYVANLFNSYGTGAIAEQGIKLQSSEGQLEFDVVVAWGDFLLLIETKCLKAVFSAADLNRCWDDVEYSLVQLQRRKRLLPEVWEQLVRRHPKLHLTETPLPDNQVILISVSNVFDFTGRVSGDTFITDDVSVARYFQDPLLSKHKMLNEELVVDKSYGYIREPGPTSVEGFIEYLRDAPLAAAYKKLTQLGSYVIPSTIGTDSPVAYYTGQFSGTLDQIAEATVRFPLES